jgi:hypothetical protein
LEEKIKEGNVLSILLLLCNNLVHRALLFTQNNHDLGLGIVINHVIKIDCLLVNFLLGFHCALQEEILYGLQEEIFWLLG